jgi:hypothetical protein
METVIPLVEQRAHRRIRMEVSANVSFGWSPLNFLLRRPKLACTTRDVSARGLQIVTDRPIPSGSRLKLSVNSATKEFSRPLKLCGDVCWSAPDRTTGMYLAGVRLHDGEDSNLEMWSEKVRGVIRQHFRPVGSEQPA